MKHAAVVASEGETQADDEHAVGDAETPASGGSSLADVFRQHSVYPVPPLLARVDDREPGTGSLDVMAVARTLDEVSALANAIGEAPHDEYIQLKDGRQLRTREEVLEWVYAMAAVDDADSR